ncbi:hypothetical protein BGX26_010557 [Mortierella sp. AD094]|nr:hypothetical protein BGX26_010557 [Mortierella sp. AD094]
MSRVILYSVLLALVAWIQVCIAAPVQISARSVLPPGVYAISRPVDLLLTSSGEVPNANAIIEPPNGEPGLQEWAVESASPNTVTIRNLRANFYLAPEAKQENTPVILSTKPFQ